MVVAVIYVKIFFFIKKRCKKKMGRLRVDDMMAMQMLATLATGATGNAGNWQRSKSERSKKVRLKRFASTMLKYVNGDIKSSSERNRILDIANEIASKTNTIEMRAYRLSRRLNDENDDTNMYDGEYPIELEIFDTNWGVDLCIDLIANIRERYRWRTEDFDDIWRTTNIVTDVMIDIFDAEWYPNIDGDIIDVIDYRSCFIFFD